MMNKADNQSGSKVVDSFLNFETVKVRTTLLWYHLVAYHVLFNVLLTLCTDMYFIVFAVVELCTICAPLNCSSGWRKTCVTHDWVKHLIKFNGLKYKHLLYI